MNEVLKHANNNNTHKMCPLLYIKNMVFTDKITASQHGNAACSIQF